MSDLSSRLSLSTCWCSHRHSDGYEMLAEIREMGFHRTELSHGVLVELVPGIIKAVEEGIIDISSVHNFCPLPGTVQHAAPNLFEPSAREKAERSLWLMHSRRTLEFAARVGARHVVMHSGSVKFRFRSPETILNSKPAEDSLSNPPSAKDSERALNRLRSKAAKTMPRVLAAYEQLFPAALSHGLILGSENREGALEVPLDDEFLSFFEAFPEGSPVGYWHDTGHARIKHLAGRLDHERHLTELSDRLIGFHLHDVNEAGKDHQVPGTGSVDFKMVARFVRPHHTLVLEPSPKLSAEEILQSRSYLLDNLA